MMALGFEQDKVIQLISRLFNLDSVIIKFYDYRYLKLTRASIYSSREVGRIGFYCLQIKLEHNRTSTTSSPGLA